MENNVYENAHNGRRNDEYMRVFGLPRNDAIYDIDRNALYGFSFNINGKGWMSQVCSWDFAYGMFCGFDVYDDALDGYDVMDDPISFAFFELDDNERPKAIITNVRMPVGCRAHGNFRTYSDLTTLAVDVESLVFEV